MSRGRKKVGFTNGSGKGFTNGAGRGMTNGLGRTNGLTNGSGRTNGLTNGSGRGRTNGLTNGNGRTNGLTNGTGRTNGRGRTNGLTNGVRGRTNGLTNGTGRTNGFTNGRGRTNGLTNGLGRTNGLTNGLGRTNGLTNGLGRTNGLTNGLGRTNGMTNGLRLQRINNQRGAVAPRKLSFILILTFLILMPVTFAILLPGTVSVQAVQVDAKFKDWDKMTHYTDTAMYSDPVLDISEFAVAVDKTDFFAYVQAQGNLLSRPSIDRYFVFIDADGSAATGYAAVGLGAEYVVEAYGYNAGSWQVSSSKFFGADQSNWSAFGNIGSGHAESVGAEMELKASLDSELSVGGATRVRFATMTGSAIAEVCAPVVDGANGALVITQMPQDVAGIVTTDSLLSLQLRAVGKDVVANSLTVSSVGVAANQGGFTTGTIAVNTAVTVAVTGDVAALANGTLVKASVSMASVTSATYNVNGNGLAAYAKVSPTSIAIDGAFADWASITKTSDGAADVTNPNIDIVENAAAAQSSTFFAYVKFNGAGKAMSGMAVPSVRVVPTGGGGGGGGGTTVLPRVAGEDLTRIYIDSVAGGSAIGGIQADYLVEVRGKNGAITAKNLMTWPGMSMVSVISSEAGANALEASVPLALIGSPTGTIRMFVETTDWEKKVDTTTGMTFNFNAMTRSAPGDGLDSFGSPVIFNSASTPYIATAFDSTDSKIVVAYQDTWGNFNYGVVRVGTVSGSSISFGAATTFNSAVTRDISVTFTTDSKVLIAYSSGAGFVGTAKIGTVSGTSITSFGPAAIFHSGITGDISVAWNTVVDRAVIAYTDYSLMYYGNAIVGSISGTTITFGSAYVFSSYEAHCSSAAFVQNSGDDVIVIAFCDSLHGGSTVVGTVSGLTIIFGPVQSFYGDVTTSISVTYDHIHGYVVIAYRPDSGAMYGTAIVGQVAGAGASMSWFSSAVFNYADTWFISATFDVNINKVVIAYSDGGNSYYGTVALGTISVTGTSITFDTPEVFATVDTGVISTVYDSINHKVVICYQDNDHVGAGNGIVMSEPEFPTIAVPIIFCVLPFVVFRARKRKD